MACRLIEKDEEKKIFEVSFLLPGLQKDDFLKTKVMRDQEERQKRAKHSKTTIRVKLPDQTMVQAVFSPDEPVSSLYEWLRSTLKSPLEFELCMPLAFSLDLVAHFLPLSVNSLFSPVVTPPRKTLPDISVALYDIGLVPAALVFLAWNGDVNPGPHLPLVFVLF